MLQCLIKLNLILFNVCDYHFCFFFHPATKCFPYIQKSVSTLRRIITEVFLLWPRLWLSWTASVGLKSREKENIRWIFWSLLKNLSLREFRNATVVSLFVIREWKEYSGKDAAHRKTPRHCRLSGLSAICRSYSLKGRSFDVGHLSTVFPLFIPYTVSIIN